MQGKPVLSNLRNAGLGGRADKHRQTDHQHNEFSGMFSVVHMSLKNAPGQAPRLPGGKSTGTTES